MRKMALKSSLAIVSVVVLVSMLLSCNSVCRKNISNKDSLAVELSIVYVGDNFIEDSVLQRENVDKDRRISIEFKLKNNSSINKYIPVHGLGDSVYNSNLGFYVNDTDIAGVKLIGRLRHKILPPNDSVFWSVIMRGCDLEKAGLRENIPLPELLSKLQVRYDKDARDTIYSKYPIADIRVVRNLDIVVDYKSYKNRNEFLD